MGGEAHLSEIHLLLYDYHISAHTTVRSNSQQFSAFRVVSETFMVTKAPGMLLQPPFITQIFPVFCSCVTFQLPNLQIPFSQVCCKISQNPCEKPTIQCSSLCSSFPFSSNSPPGDASKQEKKKEETPRYSIFKNDPLRSGRLSPGGHGNAPGRGRSGPAAPAGLGRAPSESARTNVLGGPRSSQLSADEALLQTFACFVFALSGASASCPTHRGGRGPGGKLSAQVLSKSDAARTRPRGISRSPPPPPRK